MGRGPELPVLLTIQGLIAPDEGLLGQIWRLPTDAARGDWTAVSCGETEVGST